MRSCMHQEFSGDRNAENFRDTSFAKSKNFEGKWNLFSFVASQVVCPKIPSEKEGVRNFWRIIPDNFFAENTLFSNIKINSVLRVFWVMQADTT